MGEIEFEGKTRQTAENKQTFDFTGKIEIEGKTRQNVENQPKNKSGRVTKFFASQHLKTNIYCLLTRFTL